MGVVNKKSMNNLKEQAIALRNEGWSYNDIGERLGVAKGTMSSWLSKIEFTPNSIVIERIKNGPRKSGEVRHKIKNDSIKNFINEGKKTVGGISERDLFMLGLGLYIGEGGKTHDMTIFSNSDPSVIRIIMRWFREICFVPEKHFRAIIHVYPDVNIDEALNFWSDVSSIPIFQFYNSSVDKRSNKSITNRGKLSFGTVHVSIHSCGNIEFGVNLSRRIHGWILAIN